MTALDMYTIIKQISLGQLDSETELNNNCKAKITQKKLLQAINFDVMFCSVINVYAEA